MTSHVLLVLLATVGSTVLVADAAQSAYLDVEERYHIEWEFTDDNITITAKVKTTGWFGLGFSPNGGMAGADIITMGVVGDKPFIEDRHAERNGYPTMDASQDVELISGSEENGVTTIKFSRKHNTCDDKDMYVGTDTMRVIYAISPDGSDTVSYHVTNRGTRSLYLRTSLSISAPMPADAFTFDVTVEDVEIRPVETRYHCEMKRAPRLSTKHHMIKVEPLITKENLGLVHHLILYGCYDGKSREHHFKNNKTIGYECFKNMPYDFYKCRAPITIWAIGGGDMVYPEDAGFAMGDGKSPDYYLIEVHYDNPQLVTGHRDSSGMRLTLTSQLRKHDAAVMGAGTVPGIAVPPGLDDFKYTGFCTGTCTKKLLKQEVSVFGAFLHGHLAARQISARQFRDGKELRIIDEDRHYDFNYQQYRMFQKPIDLRPGDDVMVSCHYNTKDRQKMTYGGNPSSSEMCLTYLFYYPAQELANCLSSPGWSGSAQDATEFAVKNLGFSSYKQTLHFKKGLDLITSKGLWTDEVVSKLEAGHLTFPQYDRCSNLRNEEVLGQQTKYRPTADMFLPKAEPAYKSQCAAKIDTVIG